jgi:hypothetical protein
MMHTFAFLAPLERPSHIKIELDVELPISSKFYHPYIYVSLPVCRLEAVFVQSFSFLFFLLFDADRDC